MYIYWWVMRARSLERRGISVQICIMRHFRDSDELLNINLRNTSIKTLVSAPYVCDAFANTVCQSTVLSEHLLGQRRGVISPRVGMQAM